MGLMFANATRRRGQRTGSIPVPKALVEKILHTIFTGEHVAHTMMVPLMGPEDRIMAAILGETNKPVEFVTFLPHTMSMIKAKLWRFSLHFHLQNIFAGKREALTVTVRDLTRDSSSPYDSGVSGWQESSSSEPIELSKAQRVERAKKALAMLGIDPTPAATKKVFAADSAFAMYGEAPDERTVEVSLAVEFNKPLRKSRVESEFRSTLVHEIAHGLDESLRLKDLRRRRVHEKEEEHDEVAIDAEEIAELLGLSWEPAPVPSGKKALRRLTERKKHRFVPTKKYYELPHEVTARIPEIFSQIDHNLRRFKSSFYWTSSMARSASLISALRRVSPTFRNGEKNWDQRSLARVLRAVYDRYHHEKWFPQATGVYKNRRTSRRRASRLR